MVSVFLSETVRSKALKISTRCVIISSKSCDDRDTIHKSSVYRTSHTPRRIYSSTISGPTLAHHPWRTTRSARMSASSLKGCTVMKSTAVNKMSKCTGDSTHLRRNTCATSNPSEHVTSLFRTQA
ncbi:unnamed protein product, partial [Ascophyllum nodosum]